VWAAVAASPANDKEPISAGNFGMGAPRRPAALAQFKTLNSTAIQSTCAASAKAA